MAATDAAKRAAQHLDRQFGPIDAGVMAERIDELTGLPELMAALSDVMIQWAAGVKQSDSPAIWGFARDALRIAREGRQ